jgi:hypothetical protein
LQPDNPSIAMAVKVRKVPARIMFSPVVILTTGA